MSDTTVEPHLAGLMERLGYRFRDPELLRMAMRHRSWCTEHPGYESNERLEFLGDAVLGWVVADLAYRRHLDWHEGRLTNLRKSLVNALALAELAREIDLGTSLALGRGEDAAGGRAKSSILSDAFEAVLGAVYLDGGHEASYELIVRLIGDRLESLAGLSPYTDHKTLLQELAARRFSTVPVYALTEEGPDHAKHFTAKVSVNGEIVGSGEGPTKKQAEQQAASEAVARLGES